jgi:hypothetical protein
MRSTFCAFPTMSSQPSLYRLLPVLLIILNYLPISTLASQLAVRGGCCPGGTTDDDGNCSPDPGDVGDEATDDQTAGIGFEFECGEIQLRTTVQTCSPEQLGQTKGRVLAGRRGTNWELTADTSLDTGAVHPVVDAEYILSGKTIKLGSGDLKTAANDAGNDIVSRFSCAYNLHLILG